MGLGIGFGVRGRLHEGCVECWVQPTRLGGGRVRLRLRARVRVRDGARVRVRARARARVRGRVRGKGRGIGGARLHEATHRGGRAWVGLGLGL